MMDKYKGIAFRRVDENTEDENEVIFFCDDYKMFHEICVAIASTGHYNISTYRKLSATCYEPMGRWE